jgi:Ca-activated chloride channel homolog
MKNKAGALLLGILLTLLFFIVQITKKLLMPSPPPTPDTAEVSIPWPITLGAEEKPAKNLLAKNYYVVLDNSGSMSDSKCAGNQTKEQVAKQALDAFAKKLGPKDNLGLLVFDQRGVSERVPLGVKNRDEFMAQVQASHAGGGTPLASSIKTGVERLAAQAGKQLAYGEYNLVVVTDGEASAGEAPNKVVQFVLKGTPVIIHTVGFCIDDRHSLNQPGNVLYKSANSPQELVQGLEDVLAESETFVVDKF